MDIDGVFQTELLKELIDDVSSQPRSSISRLPTLLTILPRVRRLRTLLSTPSTQASCHAGETSQGGVAEEYELRLWIHHGRRLVLPVLAEDVRQNRVYYDNVYWKVYQASTRRIAADDLIASKLLVRAE